MYLYTLIYFDSSIRRSLKTKMKSEINSVPYLKLVLYLSCNLFFLQKHYSIKAHLSKIKYMQKWLIYQGAILHIFLTPFESKNVWKCLSLKSMGLFPASRVFYTGVCYTWYFFGISDHIDCHISSCQRIIIPLLYICYFKQIWLIELLC